MGKLGDNIRRSIGEVLKNKSDQSPRFGREIKGLLAEAASSAMPSKA
jgi:hypothetical protein